MSYTDLTFISVFIFAAIHLFASRIQQMSLPIHAHLLSAGGGIAIAYVFIDLLPKLSESDSIVSQALSGVFPYFERHVYIMALLGFLLFFVVDRVQKTANMQAAFYLSLSSYSFFNFLIGYAVADKNNPEVQPLALFTIALALHYFTNDYSLSEAHGAQYQKFGKWILILSLFLGWLTGLLFILSPAGVALVSAFIGGGVIMNVTRHELPVNNPNDLGAFLSAAAIYTAILLAKGS
jgi:hypothetical protein